MNTWTCIISHHLGYEGEVCGSAVRQKGTVVMSRPWASVHPQHGADSRGGRWWAHAALGGSFPGRARPLASVHLMGGAEELGIPQLRQRHVRSMRAVNLSQSHKSEKKKDDAGGKKEKKEGIPKKEQKNGTVKKQNKSGWPPLKKEETVSLPFHRVVSQEQFGTFECGVDAYVWPQELLDAELSDWLAAYLSTKLLLCPGQAISALVSPGRLRVCACVLMYVI